MIKADAAKAGININLKIDQPGRLLRQGTFGNSDWLDGTMSLVDYGDRGVPNVFLTAPLTSDGPWNAARFHNSRTTGWSSSTSRRWTSRRSGRSPARSRRLLLAQTPIMYPYWIDGLTASTPTVGG